MDSPYKDLKIGETTKIWAQNHDLRVHYLAQCESTNDWAKQKAFEEDESAELLTLYLTEFQTAGRGRGSNSWLSSESGSSLLSSWSYQLESAPLPLNTVRLGLALCKAVSSAWPYLPWSLKAPNDLYLGDKKVAGLLVESISQGSMNRWVVGLGMNIFSYPAGLPTATSLVSALPMGLPLLGDDYVYFLDRWIFECTQVLEKISFTLNESECESVRYYLNRNPLLKEKYTQVHSDGSLETSKQKTSWMEI